MKGYIRDKIEIDGLGDNGQIQSMKAHNIGTGMGSEGDVERLLMLVNLFTSIAVL